MNSITVVGNIAGDPEIRYTPQGKAVVEFSVADTPRRFDNAANKWVDGETTWWRVSAWDALAQNTAASLKKGDQVIVIGRLSTSKYKDSNTQEDRTSQKLTAEAIGPSLQFATASVTRANRNPGGNGGGQAAGGNAAPRNNTPVSNDDDIPF